MLQIRNLGSNELIPLVRDVCHQHPAWVHQQCETDSESELQLMLDIIREQDYIGAGEDECGISTDIRTIIDNDGRRGVVIEERERGLFARPEDVPDLIADKDDITGVAGAQLETATWWSKQPDGTVIGKWYDSPLHASIPARRA